MASIMAETGKPAGNPDCDVVVIGAGFAGLYAAHKFTTLGFSVAGFEKGDNVGGVWYWNRYPGARCDCESYYYSYSFSPELEQDWKWSLRYSEQPEILRYLNHVADRFDLRRHFRFGHAVTAATFDDASGLWTVEDAAGARVTARFVVSAAGCLSHVQRPAIAGLDDFTGELLYTGAWPPEGRDFTGKRVGVIGTGASGVQAISRIAKQAKELVVFQRTANWVIPVWNAPTNAQFDTWVKANYRDIRAKCFASSGGTPFDPPRAAALAVSEAERRATLEEFWGMGGIKFFSAFSDVFASVEANEVMCDFVRAYIRSVVKDPKTAALLTPNDHPIGTKRPPMDDEYYASFNLPHVKLVDIRSNPITGMHGNTIETGTDRHDFDALVLATGFDAITGALLAIDVRGRGGRSLRKDWAQGAGTYLGLGIAGFPNLFTVTGPLSPSVLANMPVAVEQHVDWIARCLTDLRDRGLGQIEATEDAQTEWTAHVAQVADQTLYPRSNSWYFGSNIPGKPRQFGVYVGGFSHYRERCETVARDGYSGFRLS
jgi:cation diffusion facilitator CzcD-associated flavoprotein CzcO